MAKPSISNPGSYSGQKVGDLRHGFGRYEYPGGIYTYEGEWYEGEKHGSGILRFADKGLYAECGSEYEGQFLHGEMTGYGVRRWKDGCEYAGQFEEGERQGKGRYTYEDGTAYEGDFVRNRFHGVGTWVEADGTVYEGQFANHKRNGQGKEVLWDGSSFDGDWEDGKRGGNGTWITAGGAKYEGQWKNGVRHGDGVFSCEGYTYDGTWINGEPTIPAGEIVLKTARSDTDDFMPAEVDFMNPVAPERLEVDADAFQVDGDVLEGWIPIPHLVFYVKKPPAGDLPDTPAKPAPEEEEVDLNVDYSKAPPTPPKKIVRRGIEAGRAVKLQLHRWGLPKVAEGEEAPEPETKSKSKSKSKNQVQEGPQSPRQLARLVGVGIDRKLQILENEIVQSDQEGFATAKNLLVYGGDQDVSGNKFVIVCSDSSREDVADVVGQSDSLEIPLDMLRAPVGDAE